MKLYSLKTLEDLRPSPTNPRTITQEAQSGLKYSVESFGDISGITWNRRSGNLVCGHQRVKVLTEAGGELKSYGDREFIELPNNQRFPVRVVDWPEEKEAAANLAANNQEIAGQWVDSTLQDKIALIKEKYFEAYESTMAWKLESIDLSAIKPVEIENVNFGAKKTRCPKCGHEF
jgi:hypothetical protein